MQCLSYGTLTCKEFLHHAFYLLTEASLVEIESEYILARIEILQARIVLLCLALHKWELYESNNKVYTQLFRERSADNSLDDYVRTMQVSENSKAVGRVASCASCLHSAESRAG